jgi:pyroglutamyl-peptidase
MEPPSPDRMQIVPDVDHPNGFASNGPQHIHISALQVPPTYDAALESVTGLHARPPMIPPTNPPSAIVAPPPENGYDFIFHIGLAGRGPFRIERLAHKSGYRLKDSSCKHAPIIEFLHEPSALEPSQGEMLEQMRLTSASMAMVGHASPIDPAVDQPVRGFGKGYESFPEDLHTTIDVEHLVYAMKEQGVEVGSPSSLTLIFSDLWYQLYSSMDAGHCVSDYTYYCSMAESRRVSPRHDKGVQTKVLFMHCCPVGQPFGTEDVTQAIQKIILWICRNDP